MVTALLLTLLAQARERWVDPVGGDDARDGTRERPWRTLAKAVADLRGGDTLHLVPGPEPFREPLLIKDRRLGGSPERPTVIDGHGATISLLMHRPAGQWRDEGGGVWSVKLPNNAWVMDAQGHWSGFPIVFVDGRPWRHVARRDALVPGTYLLFKKAKGPGEAAYDPLHNTLYVRLSEGRTPADVRIEIPSGDNAVEIDGPSHVTIRNLTAMYAPGDGFNTTWGKGLVLENVRGTRAMDQGVSNHSSEVVVRGGRFDGNAGGGIVDINMNAREVCRVRYERCVVENDVFRGGAEFHSGEFAMEDCVVRNNPGKAVELARGARLSMRHCLLLDEGGAIGVRVSEDGVLTMERCTVAGFKTGLAVGPASKAVHVRSTAFLRCATIAAWPDAGFEATADENLLDPAPILVGTQRLDPAAYVERTGRDRRSVIRPYDGPWPPAALPGDVGARLGP